MDSVHIEYRIKLSGDRAEAFKFALNSKTFDLIQKQIPDPPKWAELSFRQCSHCPLSAEQHRHCPVALQLCDIAERFDDTRSIDEVELEVVTNERRVIQTLDIQRAIASILDLILPICGCPKTALLKPLARFHLPLASEEETVFRVTGMYLLAQYFLGQTSQKSSIELDGLTGIYHDLHILHKAVASRLQAVTQSDSLKNAFALVDMYSILVPLLIEDQLVEMRGFFASYLPVAESKPPEKKHLETAKALKLELMPFEDESQATNNAPSWLEEIVGVGDSETSAPKETSSENDDRKRIIDQILSRSELTLSLEPMAVEDENEESSQSSMEFQEKQNAAGTQAKKSR